MFSWFLIIDVIYPFLSICCCLGNHIVLLCYLSSALQFPFVSKLKLFPKPEAYGSIYIKHTHSGSHTEELVSRVCTSLASIHPLTFFNLLQVVDIPQTVAQSSRHSSFVLLRLVTLIQLVTSILLKNVPFLVPDTYVSLSVLKLDSPSVCQNLALIHLGLSYPLGWLALHSSHVLMKSFHFWPLSSLNSAFGYVTTCKASCRLNRHLKLNRDYREVFALSVHYWFIARNVPHLPTCSDWSLRYYCRL